MSSDVFAAQMQETPEKEGEVRAVAPRRKPKQYQESEQIYVMGNDLVGRYITHILAGVQTIPPVRFLLHRINLWQKWQESGCQLTLHRGNQSMTRKRVKAEFMSKTADTPVDGPFIQNLIVTVPPGSVAGALKPILHRLDSRSTICLIHDGLGVAESLIENLFPDPITRPAFVLGHMTTSLGYTGGLFSVAEIRPGRLYLSLFGSRKPLGTKLRIKRHPPMERVTRFKDFMRLLVTIPGLNATSHPLPDFLRYKLPIITLLSVADPLAALFNVSYDQLTKNQHSRKLVESMLWEVCDVVAKLPECRNIQKFQRFHLGLSMHREFFMKMNHRKTTGSNKMALQIFRGWETDIDYLTGYFTTRAREVNVPVPNLLNVLRMLKAKRLFEHGRQAKDIPFEGEQMNDTDPDAIPYQEEQLGFTEGQVDDIYHDDANTLDGYSRQESYYDDMDHFEEEYHEERS